jgi:CheY-like chemotaxis protein/two-component sensor histidine kinase
MLHAIHLETEIENQKRLAMHQARLAAIGELAAGVGHEINNPLAIIKGHLEILKRQVEKKNFEQEIILDKLQKADHGIDRVANIVKGLRSFARADEEERKATNFSELLWSTIDLVREIYKKLGIEIIENITDELYVDGHKGRLQQVIMNLLSNAKDALEITHTKQIYISLKNHNNELELIIEDSGSGITDSIKTKIFDAFFTTKPINKGTGIGLSISNSIVQEHQGQIKIEDSSYGGAKFLIYFPLLKSKEANAPNTVTNEVKTENKSPLKKGKILIVEDEEEIRDLLNYMLDELGFETFGCENALEAIKQVEAGKSFDLILTDYQMPQMNGLDLIAALKEKFNYQGKTCLVTGGVQMQENGFHQLVDDVLMKPFSEEDLKKVIERLL